MYSGIEFSAAIVSDVKLLVPALGNVVEHRSGFIHDDLVEIEKRDARRRAVTGFNLGANLRNEMLRSDVKFEQRQLPCAAVFGDPADLAQADLTAFAPEYRLPKIVKSDQIRFVAQSYSFLDFQTGKPWLEHRVTQSFHQDVFVTFPGLFVQRDSLATDGEMVSFGEVDRAAHCQLTTFLACN